ncbi:hypothetical protein G9A89_011091 [Geosiphon pyriformis]|nr:hypothetical protein G9A89_011091 [Geosiphon pyriformis]
MSHAVESGSKICKPKVMRANETDVVAVEEASPTTTLPPCDFLQAQSGSLEDDNNYLDSLHSGNVSENILIEFQDLIAKMENVKHQSLGGNGAIG